MLTHLHGSVRFSYILLCGFPPVFGSPFVGILTQDDDDSDAEALEEVLFPDAYWSNISSGAKSLLRQMLHPDPASRVTAKEAQQDRWIQSWVAPPIPLPPTSPLCAPVDMNLVRSKLYKSLEAQLQELPAAAKSTSKRRHSYVPLQEGALWSSRKRAKGYSHSAPHLHRSERTKYRRGSHHALDTRRANGILASVCSVFASSRRDFLTNFCMDV
jgi:serine/threonine protein kinase